MAYYDFLKVLYSPVKAFRNIVEKPDFKGPILILVITLLSTAGLQYVSLSKIYIETSVLKANLIPVSGPPYNITSGFTNPDSPSKISVFTFNWTGGLDNVTIYGKNATGGYIEEKLIAADVSTYSYIDGNVTIAANVTTYYTTKDFADVTKVEFSKAGDNSSQYVMLGMRPEDYSSLLALGLLGGSLIRSLLDTAFVFFLRWIIYAVLFWVVLKVFREGVESLGGLFTVLGYTFVATMIFSLINIPLISALPTVNLPLGAWGPPPEATEGAQTAAVNLIRLEIINPIYEETWYSNWAYQLGLFLGRFPIFDIWVVALATIAIRSLCDLTWKKAVSISVITYAIRFLISFFIGI